MKSIRTRIIVIAMLLLSPQLFGQGYEIDMVLQGSSRGHATLRLYRFGSYYNHEVKRTRKLLLHKKEIRKLERKSKEKGFTLIPTKLYIDDRGYAKVEISLCKGKHTYDKRESIKQRETNIELQRRMQSR